MMVGHLQPMAFLEMPGGGEWMVILFIALLIFGRRLPEVARGLGKSVNEFKKGLREFQDSANEVVSDVNKAANNAVSETDTYTYEGSAEPYDGQTPSESTPDAGTTETMDESATPVAEDSSPDKSAPATPTDTFQEPMS